MAVIRGEQQQSLVGDAQPIQRIKDHADGAIKARHHASIFALAASQTRNSRDSWRNIGFKHRSMWQLAATIEHERRVAMALQKRHHALIKKILCMHGTAMEIQRLLAVGRLISATNATIVVGIAGNRHHSSVFEQIGREESVAELVIILPIVVIPAMRLHILRRHGETPFEFTDLSGDNTRLAGDLGPEALAGLRAHAGVVERFRDGIDAGLIADTQVGAAARIGPPSAA